MYSVVFSMYFFIFEQHFVRLLFHTIIIEVKLTEDFDVADPVWFIRHSKIVVTSFNHLSPFTICEMSYLNPGQLVLGYVVKNILVRRFLFVKPDYRQRLFFCTYLFDSFFGLTTCCDHRLVQVDNGVAATYEFIFIQNVLPVFVECELTLLPV